MKVTLIDFTGKGSADEHWAAANLLLFTKATRLTLNPGLLREIEGWSTERKKTDLTYMANTIPSSWEFVSYTFLVEGVSRAYTHQQVRTRAASYAQQSMRVVDQGTFDYVYTERNRKSPTALSLIDGCLEKIQETYRMLIDLGQPAEDARGILPTNIATNIICKFDMRTFVGLYQSRSGGRTQDEYQQVVTAMAHEVLKAHPWMDAFLYQGRDPDYFADIEAFAKEQFGGDLLVKGKLLKIVDKMRKGKTTYE